MSRADGAVLTEGVAGAGTRTGYRAVLDWLRAWGVETVSGVTGGGVIHFLSHMEGWCAGGGGGEAGPVLFNLGEYSAGFVPLGGFLAAGKVGACVATTGAATKLLACGLSDAKMHDIPAVYIVPISARRNEDLCPLQDTSGRGNNAVAALEAELPGGVFVLDDPVSVGWRLSEAGRRLARSKPVVLVLEHDALSGAAAPAVSPQPAEAEDEADVEGFAARFVRACEGRRVVVLAGEELSRFEGAGASTTRLCELLGAPMVWSINGVNGTERGNPYGFGYVAFGGNDRALQLWKGLGADDVLLVLGACPDEYTVSLQDFAAGDTFLATGLDGGYGQHRGSFRHRARGRFEQVTAPLDRVLRGLIRMVERRRPGNVRSAPAPADLNVRRPSPPSPGCVDFAALLRRLDARWPEGTVGFDDVCLSYKDRPFVTQRAHPHARFFSLYRGSAMGNVLGLACGAKLASPRSHVVAFTGDGCFRLFAGGLGEARGLGILLFVLDNASYAIVEQGVPTIIPGLERSRRHTDLVRLDYAAMARACGWDASELTPGLESLDALLDAHWRGSGRSHLVRVPLDPAQLLGANPRAHNL